MRTPSTILAAAFALTLFQCSRPPQYNKPPARGGPEISGRNVVNAADYSGGGVVPGEIVVLFPANAGPPNIVEWPTIFPRNAEDIKNTGRQPNGTTLGTTRVFFDGLAASIVYSMNGQVGAIVPWAVSKKKTTEMAIEYQGVRSPAIALPVIDSAPALFTLDASGKGQAAMLNETGCCNSVRNPATRGSVASLYATGEGLPVTPVHRKVLAFARRIFAFVRFQNPPAAPLPVFPVHVTVGGAPAEILYANNLGVLVVNFRVPADAPVGDAVPLVLTVGKSHSSERVTMAVRSARRSVLVVDPEDAIRNPLAEMLKRAGYEVLTAADGLEAAAQAEAHPVDLVITGVAIPAERLRDAHPQVKIIVMSEEAGPEVLRVADMLGAQAVLPKAPPEELALRRVRDLLRERPARY